MTETLEERIQRHEGLRLRLYKDSLGKLTIGYGRCLDTHGISDTEAQILLNNDIEECQLLVDKALPWVSSLDDVRHGVLVEMCFQLGIAGLLGFHNMLSLLQNKDYDGAAQHMLDSKWHDQTPERCEELANLILTGDTQ